MTRSLAIEWADQSVTANAISPGLFLPDMTRPVLDNPGAHRPRTMYLAFAVILAQVREVAVRVFDASGNVVRMNTQAQLSTSGRRPATLQELWQQDRPRTLDGVGVFPHEHPTARALRGETVRAQMLAVHRSPAGAEAITSGMPSPFVSPAGSTPVPNPPLGGPSAFHNNAPVRPEYT